MNASYSFFVLILLSVVTASLNAEELNHTKSSTESSAATGTVESSGTIKSTGSTQAIELPSQETAATSSQRGLRKHTRSRIALVIGNGDYQQGPLKNPVNDARDFAAILRKLGFEVILKTNASLRELDNSIDQFGRKLEQTKGVGLFYYAGHGVQSRGRNYLIPVSADLDRETDLKYQTVDAQRIVDEMEYAQNGLNIVILDACRDNPLSRSFRSGKRGLAKFDNTPSGLMLAYSTAPGKQAADGSGRNSPYTTQLIKSIQKENVPLEMVFKDVIKNVKKATRGEQIPWVSSSVDGDFYFSQSVAMTSKSQTATAEKKSGQAVYSPVSQSKFELLFWETVSSNPSRAKYEAYLDQYPDGHFSSIAEYELKQLKKSSATKSGHETNTVTSLNRDQANNVLNKVDTCNEHLSNKRLTSGKQGNAFDCYNDILATDPENPEALSGLKKVENIYLVWANSAVNRGEYKKARSYLSRLKRVNPESEELLTMEQELGMVNLEVANNSAFSQERSISNEKKSPLISNISQQFKTAIRERDMVLAEGLLAQIKSTKPNSRTYQNYNMEYKQLVLQMESEKLYETLIMDALEKQDFVKAEHYLNKMSSLTQNEEAYLKLKKLYVARKEEGRKVKFTLTANVDDTMVLLNGVEKGSTPLNLTLAKGDYLVELKKRGYPSQKIKLALYGNTNQHLDLTGGFATGIALENPPKGIEMMAIEPGCFNMGSPSNEAHRSSNEKLHQVCVKQGFWIGKYEITQQQWQSVMQNNPSSFDDCGPNCPVENIEWHEIQVFLKHLSNLTQRKYRLPTEAEWEYAARAGTTSPFNLGSCLEQKTANFNTGYKYSNCAVSKSGYKKSTVAVGSYPANAWGLHDVHGNVSEWTCSEFNSHYDGTEQRCFSPKFEMPGYSGTKERLAVRGGSWQYKPSYARSAYRDKEFPNANNKKMGFRVVRER